jgi:hypothetical protein
MRPWTGSPALPKKKERKSKITIITDEEEPHQ